MVVLDEWREVGVVTLWGKEDDERMLRRGLEEPPEAQWVDQKICGRIPRRWCECNGNKHLVPVCLCLCPCLSKSWSLSFVAGSVA